MAIVNHTPAYDLALAQKQLENAVARIREDYDLQRAEADRFNRENLELRKVIQDLRAENTALSTRVANDGIRMRELTAKHERLIATARAVDDAATRYGSNDMSVDLFDVQASINELRAAVGDAPDAVLPRIEARAASDVATGELLDAIPYPGTRELESADLREMARKVRELRAKAGVK